MQKNLRMTACVLAGTLFQTLSAAGAASTHHIELNPIGTYSSGLIGQSAAEIVAHDPATQRLFVVNAQAASVDVLDISDPTNPTKTGSINLAEYGGIANSVAVRNGVIAVAVENVPKTSPGAVIFFSSNLQFLSGVEVGAQPDMLLFSPNGRHVLTANEGEPNSYNNANAGTIGPSVDPEGSVSIIDVSGDISALTPANVRTAGFTAFNAATLDPSIRIFGPNATVAQDIEPEYITISQDSKTAWVTLQENNALAIIDINSATVTQLAGLGYKDHSLAENALDASDRDNAAGNGPKINITTWPIQGMYLPDGIDSYQSGGNTYLVLANEGDSRADWPGFNEEIRVGEMGYVLDPAAFPNAAFLKQNRNLGRLRVTRATGDLEGDGDFDVIHSFGARSFSIRDASGALVFDSGAQLEQLTAAVYPDFFNASNDNNTFDSRSPTKGPEPEGVVVGRAFGRVYAFIGLERIGGIAAYDITDPHAPFLSDYANNRSFTPPGGDLGPEGVLFIKAEDSPTGSPLLVTGNEISGSTTLYEITKTK